MNCAISRPVSSTTSTFTTQEARPSFLYRAVAIRRSPFCGASPRSQPSYRHVVFFAVQIPLWSRALRLGSPARRLPLQTVRADFPHTASLVRLASLVSFPFAFQHSFALIPTDVPRHARAVSDAPPQGGLSPLVGLSTITFLLAIQFASSPFTSRGPSLHGHCPASTLLWPRPTSAVAFAPQTSQVPDATFQTRRPSMPRHAFLAANRLRRFFSASLRRWTT